MDVTTVESTVEMRGHVKVSVSAGKLDLTKVVKLFECLDLTMAGQLVPWWAV